MSSHLIQPIELFDINTEESLGLQCIKHGNTMPKWRTVSTLFNPEFENYTSLVGSENNDKWAKVSQDMFVDAGVSFGTSCLKSATLRFYLPEVTAFDTTDPIDPELQEGFFDFSLYINGIEIVNTYSLASGVEIGDPAQTVDYIVDLVALGLECRPCGNIWAIGFGYGSPCYEMSLAEDMTMEIVDVTF